MDILEKACYLLTTLKKSIFSKVAGPGLQSVASLTTKIQTSQLSWFQTTLWKTFMSKCDINLLKSHFLLIVVFLGIFLLLSGVVPGIHL